ncbi:MAG TPA: pyridoxal phosphate-dependent aminotransferase [Gemmatimonadales bacterium]
MRPSHLTRRIAGEGSDAWITHDRAVERLGRGEDVILLSIGDPDFDTPPAIREAATRALADHRTHYAPIGGEPELRAAIAATSSASLGWTVHPDQVVVYPGAQAALYALAQCLFNPGDEVIAPEPTYVTYQPVIASTGAAMRQVPLRPERQFHLDPEDLARVITPRTRALMLNFPHNPTGATLALDEAQAVAALVQRHDLVLISDEVYAALSFATPHLSPASLPGMAERTAVVSSLSKSHAMTGWRCGWSITPGSMIPHLQNLARAMYFGVAQFIQDAAAVALTAGGEELAAIRAAYARRARLLVDVLAAAPGLLARTPEAGMYLFADVRGTGLSGKAFAARLLDATGVAVTPGEGFGPSGAGHVRITLGTGDERLAEAGRRIVAFCEAGRGRERAG